MHNVIKMLRESLHPAGTQPLIRLKISGVGMFDADFVTSCIDDLENKSQLAVVGLYEFTPLDKLALQVLTDSAHLKR
jgi:hypothetical protein